MLSRAVYLTTLIATLFCAAINAYTYQVMYPVWRTLDAPNFVALHRDYLDRLWPVITVPHVVMFFASAALIALRPAFISRGEAIAVFALDAGVVVLSAFWAGPIHSRFEQQHFADAAGLRTLIAISLARTAMMIASCWVLCAALLRGLRAAA